MEMLKIRNYDINFSPLRVWGIEVHFSLGKQKSVKHKIWPTFKQLINLKSTHERAKPDEGPKGLGFWGIKSPMDFAWKSGKSCLMWHLYVYFFIFIHFPSTLFFDGNNAGLKRKRRWTRQQQ